jgi:hypothetical protein
MPNNFELILDVECEVYAQLNPYADDEFRDFSRQEIVPGAVYVIGRIQSAIHIDKIKHLAESGQAIIVFSNPAEGSETIASAVARLGLMPLIEAKKVLLLGGGDMEEKYPYYRYDCFLVKILDYLSNKKAMKRTHEIFEKKDKPYKFLFLNGRTRPNRKYLLEKFRLSGLLDQSLWTNLQSSSADNRYITLTDETTGKDLMYPSFPYKLLPKEYEIAEFQNNIDTTFPSDVGQFIKPNLFNNEWGEVHLKPEVYIDTYFSLVTETVFTYPYSFRTEKIAKPLAIGHPWIVAANTGYYRDMRNLGFKTFGHLIDEGFDEIVNDQDRIHRIWQVTEDLCKQDLPAFLAAAEEVCKYNQQHLKELRSNIIRDFPEEFVQFLTKHINERSRI